MMPGTKHFAFREGDLKGGISINTFETAIELLWYIFIVFEVAWRCKRMICSSSSWTVICKILLHW